MTPEEFFNEAQSVYNNAAAVCKDAMKINDEDTTQGSTDTVNRMLAIAKRNKANRELVAASVMADIAVWLREIAAHSTNGKIKVELPGLDFDRTFTW